ncbi:25411_t:CDS:2, partial [Racocetra persica]
EFTDTTIYNETYLEMTYNIVNIPYERPSAIQELNSFMKDFITKYMPKSNQKLLQRNSKEESSRRNSKRILSAKTYNMQSSSDESD